MRSTLLALDLLFLYFRLLPDLAPGSFATSRTIFESRLSWLAVSAEFFVCGEQGIDFFKGSIGLNVVSRTENVAAAGRQILDSMPTTLGRPVEY